MSETELAARHQQLVQRLIVSITGGAVSPGDRINPGDVGETFGCSRTVVREAFRVLETLGMLAAKPNSGTRVLAPENWALLHPMVAACRKTAAPYQTVCDVAELRVVVEGVVASRLAETADEETDSALAGAVVAMSEAQDKAALRDADEAFHRILLESGGDGMAGTLSRLLQGLSDDLVCPEVVPGTWRAEIVAVHHDLQEAIAAGKAATAAQLAVGLLATRRDPE